MIFTWMRNISGTFWAVVLYFPYHFEVTAFKDKDTKVFQAPLYSQLENPCSFVPHKGVE